MQPPENIEKRRVTMYISLKRDVIVLVIEFRLVTGIEDNFMAIAIVLWHRNE